jgi:hypothetical protein
MVALNENGKHLWKRSYSGTGELVKLCQTPENHLILAGNHWRAKIDGHGYLVWESAFSATDSILNAISLPKGEIMYIGVRNRIKTILIKTSADNKQKIQYSSNEIQPESKSTARESEVFEGRPTLLFSIRIWRSPSKRASRNGEGKSKNPMQPKKAAKKAESSLSGSSSLANAHARNTDAPAFKPEYKAEKTSRSRIN